MIDYLPPDPAPLGVTDWLLLAATVAVDGFMFVGIFL